METYVEVTEDRSGYPLLRKPRTSQLSYACKCWFLRRGENRSTRGKNLSEQSREPTNPTHIWGRIRESILGHIGGRRVLSPLCQPCSPLSGFRDTLWSRASSLRNSTLASPGQVSTTKLENSVANHHMSLIN